MTTAQTGLILCLFYCLGRYVSYFSLEIITAEQHRRFSETCSDVGQSFGFMTAWQAQAVAQRNLHTILADSVTLLCAYI